MKITTKKGVEEVQNKAKAKQNNHSSRKIEPSTNAHTAPPPLSLLVFPSSFAFLSLLLCTLHV